MASPNTNSAARESAPYGHACAGCSKAKCRCIGRGPGNSCERCHRLHRECQPSTVIRKRLSRRPANKTTRLEEKLDDLVTLLKTQATASTPASQSNLANPPQNQGHIESGICLSAESGYRPLSVPLNGASASSERLSATPSSTCTTTSSIHPSHPPELSSSQADDYLKIFQSHHLKFLPFIHIPTGATAAHLQSERPFLWLNIRALCCKSSSEMNQLNRKIREILAQSLLVDLERSLDLLLGLVVYLAWIMNYIEGKKILSTYSNLAISLVTDLRLDRPGQEDPCTETDSYKAFGYPIKQYVPASYRTNEERRAVLACFVACSSISSLLKTQPMRWTPHMEDCLKHLADEPETPGDQVLAAIVKISKVKDDLNIAVSARLSELETTSSPKPPPVLYTKALLARVEGIKEELHADLIDNNIVQSYIYNAYMAINYLPLYSSNNSKILPGLVEFGRTECVYACLHAIERGLDIWFSFTPNELFGMSMALMLQFGLYTHVLYRLSIIEDPAWDRAGVRKAVDLIQVLERGAELVGSVPQTVGLQTDGDDFFTTSAMTLRHAIPIWKRAFSNTDTTGAGVYFGAQACVEPGIGGVGSNNFVSMDFFDDTWLPEIWTSWETY